MAWAMVFGAIICITGLSFTYFIDLSPGASIVVFAIALYAIGFIIKGLVDRRQRASKMANVRARVAHPEHHNNHSTQQNRSRTRL